MKTDELETLTGELIGLANSSILNFALAGDSLRQLSKNGQAAAITDDGFDEQEAINSIALVEQLETLIRSGLTIGESLEIMRLDGATNWCLEMTLKSMATGETK